MSAVAFLDESGDESGKLDQGASRLYLVGLVVFADRGEAERCGTRIAQLRRELRKHPRFEFHFRDNGHADRQAFLTAVAPFAFTYYAVTFAKPAAPPAHIELYLDACARVCALAEDQLARASLTVDLHEPDKVARDRTAGEVRRHVNRTLGSTVLGRVRARKSTSEHLVQLADYVAGVRRWVEEGRRGADEYRRLLRAREGRFTREQL